MTNTRIGSAIFRVSRWGVRLQGWLKEDPVPQAFQTLVSTRVRSMHLALRPLIMLPLCLLSLAAHAQTFCAAGTVQTGWQCGVNNPTVSYSTADACGYSSLAAGEADIEAHADKFYVPPNWVTPVPGTLNWHLGANPDPSSAGTSAYLADNTPPNGAPTILDAYTLAGACGPLSYFVTVPLNPVPPIADSGRSCPACTNGPLDPVNPLSGGELLAETDIGSSGFRGSLLFRRYYNSRDITGGDLGPGWRHSYSRHLTLEYSYPQQLPPAPGTSSLAGTPSAACTAGWNQIRGNAPGLQAATSSYSNGVCTLSMNGANVMTLAVYDNSGQYITVNSTLIAVHAYRDDGHILNFAASGSSLTAEAGVSARLSATANGYQLTDDNDDVESYDSTGKLLSIVDRAGNPLTLSYDATTDLLSSVTDAFGDGLVFTHDGSNRLSTVALQNGVAFTYGYDGASHLSTVTNPDGSSHQFLHTSSNWYTGISSLVDENGATVFSLSYDTWGRVLTSTLGGVSASMNFTYNADGTTTETDSLGAVRTFSDKEIGGHDLISAITGAPCPSCGYSPATTYDAAGWVSSRTDYNGNRTCYTNDPIRGLELVRVEGFAPGSTCPTGLASYTPTAGTAQRKISTQWSSTWRLPSLITEATHTTAFTFDPAGTVHTKKITDTTVSPTVSRTWAYTYNSFGQVLTVDGPLTNGDVTTYTYNTCSTGGGCGQPATIKNPAGHIITFNTYNAYGQPLTITDANSVVTTLTYDLRQRLKSSTVGSELTQYGYWPTGLLKTVTLPDGSIVTYAYDAAHRLTTITDGVGNYLSYAPLDALGNHTNENSYDPSGVLHRAHTRVFNTLNQLSEVINAAGTVSVTTTYGFDLNGNLTLIAAPLARNTGNQFDELNRIKQITDPASGITKLAYNEDDRLTSVIDPRTLATSYTNNGFGEVTKVVSPDTGTSLTTYDASGHVKTTTDARGAVGTYTVDNLYRVKQIAYTDQTLIYGYDAGTNGKGRLTSASDANHSMSWSYDPQGRVKTKGQTVAGIARSVGYTYTNGDLVTLVTPSGQTITYGYTNHRITSIKVGSTTLLSGVTYDPFGPATGWTWGNNTSTVTRAFDEDGLPHQLTSAGVTYGYTPDSASRITGITDSGLATDTFTFTYDLLDRVKTGTSTLKNRGYTYDANSNRLTTTGTTASTEHIDPASNRLSSTTGGIARTYGYDLAGNTTSFTGEVFTFNQRGRMSSATSSAGATNYVYNALGQLIEKSGNGGTTLFVYDEAGHLLGEYSSTGALVQETIWMGDTPVATLRPNGSTGCTSTLCIFYVHTDHLGTPRKITRPSDNSLMWRWDPDTFGSAPPTGTLTYNLRFPGQYALSESGLNYNGRRTYDPQMGRYLESDRLGLFGGSYSTYSYTNNNPLMRIDPFGLAGGPPEADETEEQREETEPENLVRIAETARVLSEIRELDPGYGLARLPGRLTERDIEVLEAHLRQIKAERACRNTSPPPLRRIHSDQTLTSGSNRYDYESLQKMPTTDIVNSLRPDASDPLTVRPDGTIIDGNTRVYILEQRGYNVNSLPRTVLP